VALTILRIAGPILAGYLLGGIPFGVIIARVFYRIDITTVGSGNTGGTNVYRNLGWKPGVAVGILDIVKAMLPTALALLVADPAWGPVARDWLAIGAGMAAVAGHSYSPYFRLRGGKGVATAGGVAIVLMPLVAVTVIPFFGLCVAVTRIVSVSSLACATVFPFLAYLFYPDRPALTVFSVVAAVLVWWRHRSNIARLLKGEEPRIGRGGLSLKGREALEPREQGADAEEPKEG
jgi:glycerol-3-phosphate acyltransferase PlsY